MSLNAIQAWPKLDALETKDASLAAKEQHKPNQLSDLELLRVEQAAMDQTYQRSFDPLWFLRSGWHQRILQLLSWTAFLSWLGRAKEAVSSVFRSSVELCRRLAHSAVSRLPRRKAPPLLAKTDTGELPRKAITERIRIRPPSKNDSQALRQLAHCLDTIRGTLEESSESSLELDGKVSEMMVAENEGKVVGFVIRSKSS